MGTTAVVKAAELHRAANRGVHQVRLLQINACIRKRFVASQSGIPEVPAGAIRARRR